jgi:hypothetical protein
MGRKEFFFEKKNQKTFGPFEPGVRAVWQKAPLCF